MIKKILWATNGFMDREATQKYVALLANIYGAKVYVINVVPEYKNFVETLSEEDGNHFSSWVENTLIPKEKNFLNHISKEFQKEGISSNITILKGIPSQEIINAANKFGADLIVLGKGRSAEKNLLGGTALKVLRNSTIPVLCVNRTDINEIKNILVPSDLDYLPSTNLEYAAEFAKSLKSKVHNLNVVVLNDHDIPKDIVSKLKDNAYLQMKDKLVTEKLDFDIGIDVEADKNAWMGIVKYANEKNQDLIIMNTHGDQLKKDFVGNVAEKVVQEAPCPVLTIKP